MAINYEFLEVLINLQHSDNVFRNNAEISYDTLEPKTKLELLFEVISEKTIDLTVRIFAGVLCRRLLDSSYEEAFSSLTKDRQLFAKKQLLAWILNEENVAVRKKMCDIVVEVAKEQFDDDGNLQWPELFSFVFEVCLSSQRTDLKTVGLNFFASLPHILGDQLLGYIDSLVVMFVRTLSPNDENGLPQSLEVREASVKAFAAFIASQMDEAGAFNSLTQVVPLLLQTTADCISTQPENDTCMKAVVELSDSGSDLLKPSVNAILDLCANILRNNDIDESQKHLAVEVFVSLSENYPAAVRKCPSHLQSLMEMLFKMLTEIEDDPAWATLDVEEEEDESSWSIVAEMALDRISCAMRGKKVLQEITHVVPAMLHSPRWQERHGGLMAISSCAEGLNKVMGEMLGSIIDEIVPLLMDPHPRVRYAACNAVGQLSTDFGTKLQKMYHAKVLPALLAVLDDDDHPRVQAYAGAAMVNFCEAAPKAVVVHYLPLMAHKLLHLLQAKYHDLLTTGRKLVLEQIVTTVAAVADSAADQFAPYYDQFMTFLKYLMGQCGMEGRRLLRAKAMECISLMGLAVGRATFLRDAHEVMQLLMESQCGLDSGPTGGGQDDPHRSYLISAWARMCQIMGRDFAEFLPLVMRPVLTAASIRADVCMLYNEEAHTVDKDWQVVKIADDQNFAIHTSGLEEKAAACEMLVCYARELTDSFSPWVVEVADIMIPLLKFYFNEDVRSSASNIMPHLLECSRPLGSGVTESLWDRVLSALLSAIPLEPYREQVADMLASIAEGIKKMGRTAVTVKWLETIVAVMLEQFEELFKSQDARTNKRRSDEYDEDDEDRLEEAKDEDDRVLCRLVDLMHSLFLVYGPEALPVFNQCLGHVLRLQEPGRPWTDLQYGLCFWDDMVETMGPASWPYGPQFLPTMVAGLSHARREVRQAAVYGCGLLAMFGGPEYAGVLREVGGALVVLAEGGGDCLGDEDEDNVVRENAVSALAKVCKYRPECVPRMAGRSDGGEGGVLEAFLRAWVHWLPVWEDTEETGHVYGLLCDLADRGSIAVLGDMCHVVRSIGQCWHRDGMDPGSGTYGRCVSLVRAVQGDEGLFLRCLEAMTTEEVTTMHAVLSSVPQ